MAVSDLYTKLVLDHSRAPRNFGALQSHTHAADGANPLCGDTLHVELTLAGGRIAAIRFRCEACAIVKATASLLSECATQLNAFELDDLDIRFARMLNGDIERDDALGDLNALAPLAHYPTRRKCALLPFAALRAALGGAHYATTEGNPHVSELAATSVVLSFRYATHADIPVIEALVTSAYRGDASRQGWTTEADLLGGQRVDPASVAEMIDKANSRVLLAEQAGRLLACCHIENQGNGCYFGMFAVDPTLQGGGVGKLVMSEAERVAREEFRCVRMEMTVISVRDDLIAWYERRGYERSGIYKPFPYGDERFGIPKRDDLRFELLVKAL